MSNDKESAREVAAAKPEINRLAARAEDHLSRRLAADAPNRLAMFRLESEIMEYLKRMYYFAKRVAKLIGEVETTSVAEPVEEGSPREEVAV